MDISPISRSLISTIDKAIPKLSALALTALAINTIANIPTASAGPYTYATCVLGIEFADVMGLFGSDARYVINCIQGCTVALLPWCP